jgi:hypothetical protein
MSIPFVSDGRERTTRVGAEQAFRYLPKLWRMREKLQHIRRRLMAHSRFSIFFHKALGKRINWRTLVRMVRVWRSAKPVKRCARREMRNQFSV